MRGVPCAAEKLVLVTVVASLGICGLALPSTKQFDYSAYCWDKVILGPTPNPLTRTMCRKAVRSIGEPGNLRPFHEKLRIGKCVRIVALGGSITLGKTLKSHEQPWTYWLELKLNADFPCAAGRHVVNNRGTRAKGSNFWVSRLTDLSFAQFLDGADLIIVESAANDAHELLLKNTASAWAPSVLPGTAMERYTELLVRGLHHGYPTTGLLWLTAGWRAYGPEAPPPYHLDAEDAQGAVLKYYGIAHVSLLAALQPFGSKAVRQWEEDVLFNDHSCHLSQLGHKMVAQILSHFAMNEVRHIDNAPDTVRRSGSDAAAFDGVGDAVPLWVSKDDLVKILAPPVLSISFQTSAAAPQRGGTEGVRSALAYSWLTGQLAGHLQGWALREDVPGKPGLVYDGLERAGSNVLRFEFATNRSTILVTLGTLDSFEHMGMFKATLRQGSTPLASALVDCLWNDTTSVDSSHYLRYSVPERADIERGTTGDSKNRHRHRNSAPFILEVEPVHESMRLENKLIILRVAIQ